MNVAYNKDNERVSINDAIDSEKYYCQFCGEELIKKRGNLRCHHFAHKKNSECTESEWHDTSPWHINWQNQFPINCQEILRSDFSGKKHIADVLINETTVIEFQHSNLPYEIYNDRNEFYNRMGYKVIWVFDGNEIINNGDLSYKIHYRNPLKPLSKQGTIPIYLDIFIEGTIERNLLDEEEGKFLYHVSDLSSIGIELNGKIRPDEFINKVNKNEPFVFGDSFDFIKKENKQYEQKPLREIIREHPKSNYLIALNAEKGYDVLIDRYNMDRAIEGKFIKGKMKSHKSYGNFQNRELKELYYVNDPVWIFQEEYK